MCGLSGKVTLIVGVEQRAIKVSGWLWSSESHVVWDEYEANDHNFDSIEIRLPECSAAAVERFSRCFRTDHFWDPEDPRQCNPYACAIDTAELVRLALRLNMPGLSKPIGDVLDRLSAWAVNEQAARAIRLEWRRRQCSRATLDADPMRN
jgi:hypothetical protein